MNLEGIAVLAGVWSVVWLLYGALCLARRQPIALVLLMFGMAVFAGRFALARWQESGHDIGWLSNASDQRVIFVNVLCCLILTVGEFVSFLYRDAGRVP